ncbi:MAG TPA: ISAzo13 family transposase [Candidatus Nanoarchaeia archaeon]|nr:ISAzo13 family transposase [Candidatus Nanoarchaeia archaeon]
MKEHNKKEAIEIIREKYLSIGFCLDERGRRLWAAAEARAYGRGGIARVSKAIGMSNRTIDRGLKELSASELIDKSRIRKVGAGRKLLKETKLTLLKALDALVEPTSRGDPESPLRWTSKSVRKLTDELNRQGYVIAFRTTSTLLKDLGYSLQSNKKTKEGAQHTDRDAQFVHINTTVKKALSERQPCISIDTKKKENIGEFKNNGKEYCEKGKPTKVKTHDFPDKKLGKVAPYGVYDIGENAGWVSVGISSDTAEFAVNSIRTWWYTVGEKKYPDAQRITITADCGGSNGYRVKLWKFSLQELANEIKKDIVVCHFPPGTSKWNKIEHKLFSYISKNWRGRPLVSVETVISLISNTTTSTGLTVTAVVDENTYEKGREISQDIMNLLNVKGDEFHPEWNYTISPQID